MKIQYGVNNKIIRVSIMRQRDGSYIGKVNPRHDPSMKYICFERDPVDAVLGAVKHAYTFGIVGIWKLK